MPKSRQPTRRYIPSAVCLPLARPPGGAQCLVHALDPLAASRSARRLIAAGAETTVGGVLREAAERAADVAALVEGTPVRSRRRWSYADLLAASERVARALLGRFAPGERVAIWAPNCPEWLLTEFGAALAGLTLVTVNPALRARWRMCWASRAHTGSW